MADHRTCVIGLGVMGRRMLGQMRDHPGFEVVTVWDPDDSAAQAVRAEYPGVRVAESLEDAVGGDESDVVYIAAPPLAHARAAMTAFGAGKAVYCEKPLGVDLAESAAMVGSAERSGCVNIVNFSLASTSATAALEAWLGSGAGGPLRAVEIRVRFSQWPRAWQMDAAEWLSRRAEGGFTREVLSHWIYLTERLMGPTVFEDSRVRYPDSEFAEDHLAATLSFGGIPVYVTGGVGGAGPDTIEFTIWGDVQSARITDWRDVAMTDGDRWVAHDPPPGFSDVASQLANAAAAVGGRPHTMPTFADALSVQAMIERMLSP